MRQVTLYVREDQFEKLEKEENKSEVIRDGLDLYYHQDEWNKEKFWNELGKKEKEMAEKICKNYSGSDGVKGRIFDLYQEAVAVAEMSISEYSKMFSPGKYVRTYYELKNQ